MPRTTPTNGAALRAIRERSGLSIRDLLERLDAEHGIAAHEDHIRNVETGARNAGPQLINAIADVLRVPVVALLAQPTGPKTPVGAS